MVIEQIKKDYIEKLIDSDAVNEAYEKIGDAYIPLFKKRLAHPEEAPILKDYNTMLLESKTDITTLHYAMIEAADALKTLSDTITARLNKVEEALKQEKALRDDMQNLCAVYTDFDAIVYVDNSIDEQTCAYSDGFFKAKPSQTAQVTYTIESISGNGTEGNAYIIDNNNTFLEDVSETDKREAFQDNDLQTSYEYQRITIDKSEALSVEGMHKDMLPARCDIVLKAAHMVNQCQIKGNTFLLNNIAFSNDGITYTPALEKPVLLDNSQRIESTGYCTFPLGKYIKISCESSGITSDQIALKKQLEHIQSVQRIDSASRHLIALNEIALMQSTYVQDTYFKTRNVLPYPVQAIALYADTYIPSHLEEKQCLTFELYINNKPYTIVPINNSAEGIKVIQTSRLNSANANCVLIDEPIVDARLVVRFTCPNANETAIIKHVRLLIGEPYDT